ncbi:MAG: nitrilase-related carbon-nitrogen hydrolase [Polyangiaceae bacterium]
MNQRIADEGPATRVPNWALLALGAAFTALAGSRYNVAVLGWVAAVPFLLYLRRASGWRAFAAYGLALQVGHFFQILKIVTAPLPWFFAALFSVPSALAAFALGVVFEKLRRRLGDGWGLALFPALEVGFGWLASHYSGMGSWGSPAYTQLDNLPLLQLTSLFGLSGLTALLAATSALVAVLLATGQVARWRRTLVVWATVVVAVHAYGGVRLHLPIEGPMLTVATVTSDVGLGPEGLPSREALAAANDQLFARSEALAAQGAALVVWNEGATAIYPEDEDAFVARGLELSRQTGVDLVIAYVVPRDGMRRFENKYRWLTPQGEAETYFKHHPVPSEGSIPGTDPLRVIERPWGKAAGAICYDYDYPAMGLDHARLGAGLVVLPSSDWAGIDPVHTQMASVRGIEGGFSVLRSVRDATSGAYDAHGRAHATASYAAGERVMLARVPTTQVPTLYARIGDVVAALAALVLVAAAIAARGPVPAWARLAKA